ncbi:hypothetical protein X797_010588 [Metarhizium robertsii]|uniref:Uncharacterized protein n=1 Tax=Metarhizium robertsii TaxID=568076 RepID=A0A0A1UMX1_9HYPO|nr:hypothetical protein X797_010588 [Metarhizium robertsii]
MRATAFLVTVFAGLCMAHPLADAPGDECPPMVLRTVHIGIMAVFTASRHAKLGQVDATIRSSNARW